MFYASLTARCCNRCQDPDCLFAFRVGVASLRDRDRVRREKEGGGLHGGYMWRTIRGPRAGSATTYGRKKVNRARFGNICMLSDRSRGFKSRS